MAVVIRHTDYMTTQLSNIKSLHWQPALNGAGIVELVDDIDQSIRIILKTPKGSDPLRPTFGSDGYLYIDYPVNIVVPFLVRETFHAIQIWEKRCTLVKVIPDINGSHITVRVQWKLSDDILRETVVAL